MLSQTSGVMATGKRQSNHLWSLRTSLTLEQSDTCATRHEKFATDAALHALLGAAEGTKFYVIDLQESKADK
ncbi:hypothetical protein RB195_014457 [Necator americanus]|uniref:Uncharacterized protein n=1 Tax=Necator americanus TaxID=51031 RepID=A0ABR1E0J5_NECAM